MDTREIGIKEESFSEEVIYSTDKKGYTSDMYNVFREIIQDNKAVGFIAGYYDEKLTISNVSDFFLHNLGYTIEEFKEVTDGSLYKLFRGNENGFLGKEKFRRLRGSGEGEMITKDNVLMNFHLLKRDTVDEDGQEMWVMSAHIDNDQKNVALINRIMQSGFWYVDCDESGKPSSFWYTHAYRKLLGTNDVLEFPNQKESWLERIHPEDRKKVERRFYQTIEDIEDETKYQMEYRLRMPDGTYQWFRDWAEVTRRLDDTAYRMVGILANIEEEKKIQMQVQKSEAFHRAFTKGNIFECYLDLKDNTYDVLKADAGVENFAGAENGWCAFVEKYLEIVDKQDKNAVSLLLEPTYIEEKFAEGKREISIESTVFLDGEERYIRNVVARDEAVSSGRYAMIYMRDITESKREQNNIQELTKQNEAMDILIQGMERLVDRYVVCNFKEDTYTFYSNRTKDEPYDFAGNYHDFVDKVAAGYKMIAKDMTVEKAFSPEYIQEMLVSQEDIYKFEYCTQDEKIFKSLAISPLSWSEGKVENVLLVSQDITQEKFTEMESRKALKDAYEMANQANIAKTEFLSNMSHDIRTPMNAIIGMTAIAGANIDNEERVLDCLGKISRSSRHLLGLINEVLDMSSIESGKISLTEEEFNLSDLVDNLVAMINPSIEAYRHNFEVHLDKIEHEEVCGDSLRIQQVVTNILSNAVKYTPSGGKIRFKIEEIPTPSLELGCYKFTIEDNGIGMSEEFQKIMFEPFTRADENHTSKVQGTGLGMAIAKNIVHMMNGSIDVVSKSGVGSRFTVTIFLKLQDRETKKIEELIDLPVLVVDDDRVCCENTVKILDDIGINGEWVMSGEEAVNRVVERYEKGDNYFAVIIDWKMPGMDGIETTKQIRRKVGKDITIIILSAYDYSEIENEARAAGVDEFIAKPLFRSRLTAKLKSLLDGKPGKSAKNYLDDIAECDFTGKRILLVEDNELNSEIASEIIHMSGAETEIARNGKEAVEKFAETQKGFYDLIFMDIQMPIMNGYEAASAIRALDRSDALEIPIVAMTANAFVEDVVMAKNAGMNEHISKPLDMNKLCEVMKKWL